VQMYEMFLHNETLSGRKVFEALYLGHG